MIECKKMFHSQKYMLFEHEDSYTNSIVWYALFRNLSLHYFWNAFFPLRFQPIDMLNQFIANVCPHWIKDKVYTFPASQLCCWYKITVSGNKDDLINLVFVGERGNIDADFHVDSLLLSIECEIALG